MLVRMYAVMRILLSSQVWIVYFLNENDLFCHFIFLEHLLLDLPKLTTLMMKKYAFDGDQQSKYQELPFSPFNYKHKLTLQGTSSYFSLIFNSYDRSPLAFEYSFLQQFPPIWPFSLLQYVKSLIVNE